MLCKFSKKRWMRAQDVFCQESNTPVFMLPKHAHLHNKHNLFVHTNHMKLSLFFLPWRKTSGYTPKIFFAGHKKFFPFFLRFFLHLLWSPFSTDRRKKCVVNVWKIIFVSKRDNFLSHQQHTHLAWNRTFLFQWW